jgi:hypothetical protein
MTTAAAERRYTKDPWTPGAQTACMVCGLEPSHHAESGACPHTADSLTDAQILDWWTESRGSSGGSFVDALDASSDLRFRANATGLYYPPPSPKRCDEARRLIASLLNLRELSSSARMQIEGK